VELRCENKLFGEIDEDLFKVRCRSIFCGAKADVVVLHIFDKNTGAMIETKKFRDIVEGGEHGTPLVLDSVRSERREAEAVPGDR
jgi:hypothetical protein